MDSLTYNFHLDETKAMYPKAEVCSPDVDSRSDGPVLLPWSEQHVAQDSVFSPLAPSFQGHTASELISMFAEQEPRAGDTAPPTTSTSEIEESLLNFRLNGADINFDEDPVAGPGEYFLGSSRAESVASGGAGHWADPGAIGTSSRQTDQMAIFDFVVKSVSAANNYVSMLTREQVLVLQSLRPGLLYDFLREVAKVRTDRRMRRALPNECAFCKNNGENEECYSSHALKDWRGRVLCPVLRAFRCPRCGATGDRAHTIKYCQLNNDADRAATGLSARRRMPPSALLLGQHSPTPGTPAPSMTPSTPGLSHSNMRNFNMN